MLHDEFSNMESEIFKKRFAIYFEFEGFVLILRFDEKFLSNFIFSWNFSYRDGFTVDDDRSHAA